MHIDHRVPKSAGGGDDDQNLGLACHWCNLAKQDYSVDEYMAWIEHIRATDSPILSARGWAGGQSKIYRAATDSAENETTGLTKPARRERLEQQERSSEQQRAIGRCGKGLQQGLECVCGHHSSTTIKNAHLQHQADWLLPPS